MLLEQMDAGLSDRQPLIRRLSLFGYILVGIASLGLTTALIFFGIKLAKNRKAVKESIGATIRSIRKWVYRIPFFGYWLKTIGLPPVQQNFSVIEFSLAAVG